MSLIFSFLIALTLAALAYHLWQRVPSLPRGSGDWGGPRNDDPRIAVAAMMYAVAAEDGPVSAADERLIIAQLTGTIGLPPDVASPCLAAGRRIASRVRGDLNSRLHQLKGPIERQCSRKEKEEVVDMLRHVAGASAERDPSVREGLGRLSATLLNG